MCIQTNERTDEGRFKDDNMEGQGTMKMNRNVIIPKLTSSTDASAEGKKDGDVSAPVQPETNEDDVKHDWMIPLQFQSDISHIHQKAGFTQIGL